MNSSFDAPGFMHDPSKCGKLSMEKKREFIYEISNWNHGASEMLQSWSRQELLQILCAEIGKERKYTGLTKFKMIEHLLRIVSEKKSRKHVNGTEPESQPSPANSQSTSKRQRKSNHPSRLPIMMNHFPISNGNEDQENVMYCQNSACRATIHKEDVFCKRCSCCICYQYDDNKDPSLWLVCCSEPPYQGNSCGMSCHLECAFKHERAGIAKDGGCARLDGNFYCISCGKVNDLLGCWRKQLMKAKDTRRVDILCYRVFLSQKLLRRTEKYQELHMIVDTAAKKLEAEVGPLSGLPVKMARGIVNRLSSGPEVQKLCAFAVESLDTMLSCSVFYLPLNPKIQESHLISSSLITFENVCPTSLTVVLGAEEASVEENVVYSLWHRKAEAMEYPVEPTCTMLTPNTRFSVSDLTPSTEYLFKVVSFHDERESRMWEVRVTMSSAGNDFSQGLMVERCQSPVTNGSSVSNPSEGNESNSFIVYRDRHDKPTDNYCSYSKKTDSEKLSDDASKVVSDSQDTITCLRQVEIPGESIYALDEALAIGELQSVSGSTIQTEPQRDSPNSTNDNQVTNIPKLEKKHSPKDQLIKEMGTGNRSSTPVKDEIEVVQFEHGLNSILPITPCKLEISKVRSRRSGRPEPNGEELDDKSVKAEEPQADNSSKKRTGTRWDEGCVKHGSLEREYEYCVKVVRWLECEGYIEKNFRVKFLTWYSLRATTQERRIVKVFVDTLIDNPVCLAGQLFDTFSEGISSKRQLTMPSGFCMKLWH